MFPDHSLMPKEAVRLAALGMLAERPTHYAALAAAVRDFTSHIVGPNLDLMGTSIQILCYEGLANAEGAAVQRGAALPPDTELSITDAGREELMTLLLAAVRTPFNDLNKLVIALKMRFLALLDADGQAAQIELITTALQGELARLTALRGRRAAEVDEADALVAWLDHDLAQIEDSLGWFRQLAGCH